DRQHHRPTRAERLGGPLALGEIAAAEPLDQFLCRRLFFGSRRARRERCQRDCQGNEQQHRPEHGMSPQVETRLAWPLSLRARSYQNARSPWPKKRRESYARRPRLPPLPSQEEREHMAEAHDPYAALRHRDYRRLLTGTVLAAIGSEVQATAVGWEVYNK